jgi:hypothetical protein
MTSEEPAGLGDLSHPSLLGGVAEEVVERDMDGGELFIEGNRWREATAFLEMVHDRYGLASNMIRLP